MGVKDKNDPPINVHRPMQLPIFGAAPIKNGRRPKKNPKIVLSLEYVPIYHSTRNFMRKRLQKNAKF